MVFKQNRQTPEVRKVCGPLATLTRSLATATRSFIKHLERLLSAVIYRRAETRHVVDAAGPTEHKQKRGNRTPDPLRGGVNALLCRR